MKRGDRFIIVLLAVLVTSGLLFRDRRDESGSFPSVPFFSTSAGIGYVKVSGDVGHPGIYPLSANKLAIDAIELAHPVRPVSEAGQTGAGYVDSGDALQVTIRKDGTFQLKKNVMTTSERIVMGVPLDINTMTESDLDRVPGIGPVLAGNIYNYRQKNGGKMHPRDLILVTGCGEKKYSELLKYFK